MSSLFVEDQRKAFSDILVSLQSLFLMPAEKLHSVAGFLELWQKKEKRMKTVVQSMQVYAEERQ